MWLEALAIAAAAVPVGDADGWSGREPPRIVERHIHMSRERRRQMARYSKRHYGVREARLRNPRVIVEHIAVAPTADAVFNAFAPNRRDPELGELPNVCSHYVIGETGRVSELVPLRWRCRHTVGLNHVAIGIEHVGYRDEDVLGNRRRLRASLKLTAWLRCRYGIRLRDVIGHSESLSSPYHHERVKRLRRQTHGDWSTRSMRTYRRRLARLPCEAAGSMR